MKPNSEPPAPSLSGPSWSEYARRDASLTFGFDYGGNEGVQTMTVKELMAELETKNPDALVYRYVGGEVIAEAVECTEEVKLDNDETGVLLN
jgi:hypothetical protein